jgi:hypothetical protein
VAIRASVDGIGPFVSRLEAFDKDVAKVLKSEMRAGAREVSSAAKSRVTGLALSNWGPWNNNGRNLAFERGAVRGGYKVRTSRYRKQGATVAFGYDVEQSSPGGSVFEGAGKSDTNFTRNIVGKWGPRPNARGGKRVLLPAYYVGIGPAQQRIEQAIRDAERKVGL